MGFIWIWQYKGAIFTYINRERQKEWEIDGQQRIGDRKSKEAESEDNEFERDAEERPKVIINNMINAIFWNLFCCA